MTYFDEAKQAEQLFIISLKNNSFGVFCEQKTGSAFFSIQLHYLS